MSGRLQPSILDVPRRVTAPLALAATLAEATPALAGGPLGADGTALQTSNYALDLYQGPVFAGSRVTGLAGAYVAVAEDVDGDLQNAATPAVRPFYSTSYFDYWLGFGLTFPSTLNNVDFFNSGSQTQLANAPDSFVFFTPAVNLQWGELGIGLTIELSRYDLSSQPVEQQSQGRRSTTEVSIPTVHFQVAHGFDHNQLVFGIGTRTLSMRAQPSEGGAFNSSGVGLEFGAVYKPETLPIRAGAGFRTEIRTDAQFTDELLPDANGDVVVTDNVGSTYYLPESVALPWDLNLGFAVQLGRPFNPPWREDTERIERDVLEHRLRQLDRQERAAEAPPGESPGEAAARRELSEREQGLDDGRLAERMRDAERAAARDQALLSRRYLLISTSLLISGKLEDAIGVENMVSQVVQRSGRHTVFSPRLGLEGAVLPELLKLRGGSYIEPTRFETSTARVHGTFGMDIRLVNWNVFGLWPDNYVWRVGLGGDVSRRYFSWGITIGGWYPRQRREETGLAVGAE
ncbi:MAG TPA: hypothetical protein VNN80_35675 [Polyangiaceae bacterium]|nr:hypothetical protein [Polyangiaceae bacterium]